MKQGRLLGAWTLLVLTAALPMCDADDGSGPLAGAGEAGAESLGAKAGAGGSPNPTAQGGAGGTLEEHRGGNGGTADENPGGQSQTLGGTGGWDGDVSPAGAGAGGGLRCNANNDGVSCCRDTVSCASLPGDWCSIGAGGQGNENPGGATCCDDGQRQVCVVVQGETGLEAFPRQEKCECSANRCECQLQQ